MAHPYFGSFGFLAAQTGSGTGDPRPMILGHRGCAGRAPENTLLSFERCLAEGGDAIESDIQVTRDGVPVLLHDADLLRVAGTARDVAELTRMELERLDAGYHFTIDDRGHVEPDDDAAFRAKGLRVPTLEEAFTRFPDARFNLEIKTNAHDAVASVVALVERFERADLTLLAAADDGIMRALRAELARRRVPAATSASVSDVAAVIRTALEGATPPAEIMALQIPTQFGDRELVTPALLDHAHRHGVAVHVWTVNEEREMHRLLDLGVDGLVTDFPGRLRDLVRRRIAGV
jgi:glycerophosphoryl diester phosphodiesterase